ncbi:MAG TPA: EutN/CcmL family microcompartment protein [Terriglobales bacterium]|jgi:microcompartment protein CcmK/EutM|nr:EutN/CcmL family microcompartment protein [Terriglobales bacterium]
MILARIVGTVVATRKDERLEGRKLLVCRPITPAGVADGAHIVAVDAVGAGVHETVLLVSGSSARMATGKDSPVDSAVVGIVDAVHLESEQPSAANPSPSSPKDGGGGGRAPASGRRR